MDFLGKIMDHRLKMVLKVHHGLVLWAVKWVLSKDFLEVDNRYRVNTDISSRFVATLLDLGEAKEMGNT